MQLFGMRVILALILWVMAMLLYCPSLNNLLACMCFGVARKKC